MIRTAAHGVFPGDITITDDPRARVESRNDQTSYRAEIEAYYARNPEFTRTCPRWWCCGALTNTSHEPTCVNSPYHRGSRG